MDTIKVFGHHLHIRVLMLGLVHVLVIIAAVYAGAIIRFQTAHAELIEYPAELLPSAIVFALMVLLCMVALGLYQPRLRESSLRIVFRTALSFVLAGVLMSVVFYVFPSIYLGRGVLGLAVTFALIGVAATQLLFFGVIDQTGVRRRVLFYGAGNNAAELLSRMRRKSDHRLFYLVGCISLPEETDAVDDQRLVTLHRSLLEYVNEQGIEEVVVAMDERRGRLPTEELLACRVAGVEITEMLSFYERHMGKIKSDLAQPAWFIFSDGFRQSLIRQALKRLLDIVAATIMLVFAAPILLLVALAIRMEDGWRASVFYRQERVGQGGKTFRIRKLRSMREDAEQAGSPQWAVKGDDRITRVGAVLRKYRLDELPQLIDVLKGDMSLVGPRPERPEFVRELARSMPYYELRHRSKPGITGWAQLCYPYGSSREDALEKLQFDLYYVKNGSLFLDLVILLGTAEVILFRKGAR